MKREGRQHGMVRTYRILPPSLNPRPGLRQVNSLTSPPTAGLFTKVPSKPTNHSKFTGKCGQARCLDCHLLPTTKAKVKTKGESKQLRSYDFSSTYKLLTWRVAGGRSGLDFSSVSATGILDLMSEDRYVEDHDNWYDYEDEDEVDEEATKINGDDGINGSKIEDDETHDGGVNGDDDDKMRICDVGIVIDHVEEIEEEGGWCLVEEMMIVDL